MMFRMEVHVSRSRLPFYRMLGYSITILMHGANIFVMLGAFKEDVLQDPDIQLFASFMYKFITCWTFMAQSVHAALGLSCDFLSLTIWDQYKFLTHLKQGRDILFASIVVPFSLFIPTVFWPLFLYNRELVLPYYTTKIVGTISNHIMHTAVMPATLWEIAFQPRQTPLSHKLNFSLMSAFAGCYLVIIFKTYWDVGVFPYPLMTMLYGSVYFLVFMFLVLIWLPIYYYGQWHFSDYIWRKKLKNVY